MKLIYCTEEGYHLALRYGKEVLDHDPGQDGPRWSSNAARVRRIEIGELELEAFDGVITEVDDDGSEAIYFMLRDNTGREREFDWDGGGVQFKVGGRVVVRYVAVSPEVSSLPDIISVMEMWVD